MKPLLTCLLVVFSHHIGHSQSYLNKRFDFDTYPNSLFSSVLYSNDTLYVVGVITDNVSPFRPKMLLAKIDLYGELLHYNVYNPVPNFFYGVYSNNLTKVGSGFVASEYTFTNEGLKSALYFMNDSFKVSEVVEITPPQSIGFNTFRDILVANNAIYAIGEIQINDTLAFNNLDIDIQLVKFDTQGNFIWRKSYGIWNKQEMAYSLYANGSNIIINGNKNDDGFNNLMPKYYQNWLLEIDTNGTVLNEYLDPDSLTWGTMSIISVDDGYILSGRYIDTPQVAPYLT